VLELHHSGFEGNEKAFNIQLQKDKYVSNDYKRKPFSIEELERFSSMLNEDMDVDELTDVVQTWFLPRFSRKRRVAQEEEE